MAGTPDYYAILHVPPDAGRQDIARAYRGLMRSHHPDVGRRDSARAAPDEELLRIMEAYGVLRDPDQRAAYDRLRAASKGRPIPVRKVRRSQGQSGDAIRVTPVRWESGPWA